VIRERMRMGCPNRLERRVVVKEGEKVYIWELAFDSSCLYA
jgi:hypothetical protein